MKHDDKGHVRVYELDGIAWKQVGDDIDGEANDDQFGFSVAISDDGTTVAIGAPYVSCLFPLVLWWRNSSIAISWWHLPTLTHTLVLSIYSTCVTWMLAAANEA